MMDIKDSLLYKGRQIINDGHIKDGLAYYIYIVYCSTSPLKNPIKWCRITTFQSMT